MNDRELLLLLARVERRADHVRHFAALGRKTNGAGYIAPVMAGAAWLLIKTLLLLCGREIQDHFFFWLRGTLREQNGCCDLCGTPKAVATDVACQACLEQMDADERALAIEERMDRDTGGSTH